MKRRLIKSSSSYKTYRYNGPAWHFDEYLGWFNLMTTAVSKAQAANYIKFRIKKECGYERGDELRIAEAKVAEVVRKVSEKPQTTEEPKSIEPPTVVQPTLFDDLEI